MKILKSKGLPGTSGADETKNIQPLPVEVKPEAYFGMTFAELPNDMVLSVNAEGFPLSRLGDLTWHFPQLKLIITDKSTYSFAGLVSSHAENLENITLCKTLFLMRMFSKKGVGKTLRAAGYIPILHSILYQCKYAEEHGVKLRDLVNRPDIYKPMIQGLTPARAGVLLQVWKTFNATKDFRDWFPVPGGLTKELRKVYKRRSQHENKQHPVIPPRILNIRWNNYHSILEEFEQHRHQLIEFIKLAATNNCYARCHESQLKKTTMDTLKPRAHFAATFQEATKLHNLDKLFKKHKIKMVTSITSYLSLVQYCAKALIHILTFMRSGEALLLEQKCLETASGWCEEGVYVIGISTKATARPVDTKWITIEEVQLPLRILLEVYDLIHPYLPDERKEIKNFFISPNHIPLGNNPNAAVINPCSSIHNEGRLPKILIEDEDHICLELVEPSREWRSEEKFKVGKPWPFTTHQFRRTMTVYCAEDTLMTLGPLKRILGHLSKKTTEHYQQGCSAGIFNMQDFSPEIIAEFKEAALEASNAVYIRDILYSEEKLYGHEGRKIQSEKDLNRIVLTEKIDELVARKKKGLVACTNTPIGLCLSILPCEKRAHADFTTCDGCNFSIIKLKKLDYVIEVLRLDLESLDPTSFDYKMDVQNLRDLEKMRERLISKSEKSC